MAEKPSEKRRVLVRLSVHSRVVTFQGGLEEFLSSVRSEFSDVSQVHTSKFVVQVKDRDWGGEFIDLKEDQSIENGCMLKVLLLPQEQQVNAVLILCTMNFV